MEEVIKEFTTVLRNLQNHSIEAMDQIIADTAQIKRYYQDILAELKKINAKEFVEVRRN